MSTNKLHHDMSSDTAFAPGDRVVVSERYRGAGCNKNPIGFYGHVVSVEPGDMKAWGPCIRVRFRGHISGSVPEHCGYLLHREAFPCYGFELDHAD